MFISSFWSTSVTKETWCALTASQHSYDLNSITQSYKQTQTSAQGQRPVIFPLPVTKQHLSETSLQHTRTQSFISQSQASLSGCHCVLTGYLQWGRRLFDSWEHFKVSHTDPGSVEGANQLGKQYEGTQRGLHGCSSTVSSFRSMGVQPPAQWYRVWVYPLTRLYNVSSLSHSYKTPTWEEQ